MATTNLASGVDIRMLVRQALKQQPQPTVTVLSSLLAVQDSVHYLPDEAIEETASFCGTTVNEVWSVASFYTNFRFTPPAAHTLEVCWGPTCHLAGAQELLAIVQEEFGIDREGETKDRSATLRYNTCLGRVRAGAGRIPRSSPQGPYDSTVRQRTCPITPVWTAAVAGRLYQ